MSTQELDDRAFEQAAARADDCARIRKERPVVRCPGCHRRMYQRRNGLCPWCERPFIIVMPPQKTWSFSVIQDAQNFNVQDAQDFTLSAMPRVPERGYELGAAISAVRKAAGIKGCDLSYQVGLGRAYYGPAGICAIEKGGKIPNLETAEKIAAVFGLGVLDLLQGPEHAEIIYRFGRLTPEQRVEVCEKVKGMIL